jgi:hypothetical protein
MNDLLARTAATSATHAHERIDKLEKKSGSEDLSAEIARQVKVAIAVLQEDAAKDKAEMQKLIDAVVADKETDRELIATIRELIAALKAPLKRESTMELPTGTVTMRTIESR